MPAATMARSAAVATTPRPAAALAPTAPAPPTVRTRWAVAARASPSSRRAIDLGEDAAFADVPRLVSGGRGRTSRALYDEAAGDDDEPSTSAGLVLGPDGLPFDLPKSAYGLTMRQMGALGLSGEGPGPRGRSIDPSSLSAHAAYAGAMTTSASAMSSTMMAAAGRVAPGGGGGYRKKTPPDLPSLLLDSRIVYIGMALVPQVTELIISELLWLNYTQPTKPVSLYIHSTGSQTVDGQQVAFENEAYAVIDTMRYIKPDIFTIVVGQAMGTAALLVASGKKGGRYALPNARIQVGPPRINRAFGRTANMMIKANELEKMTDTYSEMLAGATGFPKKFCRRLIGRNRWLTPADAIDARIIDKVYEVGAEQAAAERKHFEAAKAAREAAALQAAVDADAEVLRGGRDDDVEDTESGGV